MGDGERQDDQPAHERSCDRCREPAKLLTILPRTTQNPTFWIYRCASCGFVEWIAAKTAPDV
jgi:hypothetical protein